MKNFIYLLLSVLLFSCSKEGENESAQLRISTTSLNFGKDDGFQTVNVYSNTSWKISDNNAGWCSVSPSEGRGNDTLIIMAQENTSTNSRNRSFSISYGGSEPVLLNIFQDGVTSTGGGGGEEGGEEEDNKLSAPTGLNVNKDGNQIYLTWSPVSGASSYKVYRSSSPSGTYSSIGVTTTTNKYDSSPLTGFNYYKVTALNNTAMESNMSGYISYNYSTGDGGGSSSKPDAPTGVVASNYGSVIIPEIRISWNTVSNATSYSVYRSNSAAGAYSQVGSSTSYTFLSDLNPRSGDNYYKVKAINAAGESSYSSYALYNHNPNDVSPCPVKYGNCTVSGTTMTMRWTAPTTSGCGTPTKTYLRVKNPNSNQYVDLETLSGTATSVSFNYGMWSNSDGFVYVGIITENAKGTSGGAPKVYSTKEKRWIN